MSIKKQKKFDGIYELNNVQNMPFISFQITQLRKP